MGWLKRLFGFGVAKDAGATEQEAEPKSDFAIEFYPATGYYFPTYKGQYMKSRFGSGIMQTCSDMLHADYAESEAGADKMLARFKEQRTKENVKVMAR